MNVTCLVGRLTADPELRQTPNGTSVCSFSVAVNRQFADANGERQTDFINCVAWRQTAEFISRYFRKAQNIGLNGSIQTRQYQDKDTGKNRTAFEVVINKAYFVESKGSTQTNSAPATSGYHEANRPKNINQSFTSGNLDDFENISCDDGDLPF